MRSHAGELYCRATAADGNRCDCEAFLAPTNPSPDEPLRCAECRHGPSKHPTFSLESLSTSTTAISSGSRVSQPAHHSGTTAMSSKDSIRSIFNQTISGGGRLAPSVSAPPINSVSRKFDVARAESLVGYRPLAKAVAKGTKKDKVALATDDTSQVGWIAVITSGFKPDGSLCFSSPLSLADVSALESIGCAKIGDLTVSKSWTYEQCTNYFRSIFPRLFAYIDASTPIRKTTRAFGRRPTWALVTSNRRKLSPVAKEFPTGNDLCFHRFKKKDSPGEVHIILALRTAIPDAVIESWRPDLGFDFEASSDAMEVAAEDDSDQDNATSESVQDNMGSDHESDHTDDSEAAIISHSQAPRSSPLKDTVNTFITGTPAERTRKRGRSLGKNTPVDVKAPPQKKQRLNIGSSSKREIATETSQSKPADADATPNVPRYRGPSRKIFETSIHGAIAPNERTSMSTQADAYRAMCSSCSSQKRVSSVLHYVEPEDDRRSWDELMGNTVDWRHFLNPWDAKYEPLLIIF